MSSKSVDSQAPLDLKLHQMKAFSSVKLQLNKDLSQSSPHESIRDLDLKSPNPLNMAKNNSLKFELDVVESTNSKGSSDLSEVPEFKLAGLSALKLTETKKTSLKA